MMGHDRTASLPLRWPRRTTRGASSVAISSGIAWCATGRNVRRKSAFARGPAVLKSRARWCLDVSLVLVVDDDYLVRMNAVFVLEEAGFDALQAGTAEEAIGLLEARSDIEVVFTDINMPGSIDGIALANTVQRRWPVVGLLLTSGYVQVRKEDVPERGLFLGKPYQPAELVQMVQALTR